jgi:methylenetetrahydrofolate dehydrogenase (NADP+)/methenyltetrahydrofolate cyclohydrolase
MAIIFNGKAFSTLKESSLRLQVNKLREKGIFPKLTSILVGNDPASLLYTNLKKQAAERLGIQFEVINFPDSAEVQAIIEAIERVNKDPKNHGIMIQLPLPQQMRNQQKTLIQKISPQKDVDGLREDSYYTSATVKAILDILKESRPLPHELIVIVGSQGEVGSRLIKKLENSNFEVMGVDQETQNLGEVTKKADILVSATGVSELIKANMVKNGVKVIDVGSPKEDVDFEGVSKIASFITPVPGGVGPVTIVSLLENLIEGIKKN